MFFKRLEINGFKSFARKTVLEFQQGVTIIVGPNGCGKSNIFDAIRWVLGEQAPTALRATKMSDVIFNGTAHIKPANFAQVSLVIDNRSSLLPVEIKEIVITRRLFRDGESQYLINRVPCRLKDIQELFMDTGIGTTAYSMMEQGQVDFIINARPLERRLILDEAAGIAKYKARKAEALRKLERTTEDLLRLSDVVAEVKRTLNSLKRQANRARHYQELKEQMEEIQKILLCRRGEQVQCQLSELHHNFEERRDALYRVNAQVAKLEALWQDAQLKTEDLQHSISQTRSTVFSLRSELEQMKHKCQFLRERIVEYEQRENELNSELQTLKAKLKDLAEREQSLCHLIEHLNHDLKEIADKKQKQEKRIEELLGHRKEFDERIRQLNENITQLQEKKNHLTEQLRTLELAKERYEFQRAELQKSQENARTNFLNLQGSIKQKEDTLAQLEREYKSLASEIEGLQKQELFRKQILQKLTVKKAHIETETQKLKAKAQMLEGMLKNYEGYSEGVKELMHAVQRGEIEGVIDVLSEMMEVEPELESAIEAVLREKLQYVLVRDTEAGLKSIEFLERKQANLRAVILPQENPRLQDKLVEPHSDEPRAEGVVGRAIDFVRCKQEWEKVFHLFLRDVVVVDGRETAIRLARSTPHTFVTKDGKFIYGEAGELIIGNGHKDGKLLGRRRQLDKINARLKTKKNILSALTKKSELIHKEVKEIESRLKELIEKRREKEIHLSVERNELQRLNRLLAESIEKKDILKHDLTRLSSNFAEVSERIQDTESQLKNLETELQSLLKQKEELVISTTTTNEQVNELKTTLQTLHTEYALTSERKDNIEEQRQQLHTEINELKNSISKKEEEGEYLKADIDKMNRELNETQSSIKTKEEEVSEYTTRLHRQETELEELQTKEKQWQTDIQSLRRDHNEIENEVNDLKVKIAELNAQLDYLDQQAHERFRISLVELQKVTPASELSNDELQSHLSELNQRRDRLGAINPQALEDYNRQKERYEFLTSQQQDLIQAKASLEKTIKTIDSTCLRLFKDAFSEIRHNFIEIFRRLFGGGSADLSLTEPDNLMESGIEIIAQPPGKKLSHISLLSGGERVLTAIALMFALFLRKPSPFCVLDEIDASLDDANIELFKALLMEFVPDVHFIIVTHNKRTMMMGTTFYGITMEEPGVSKVISLQLDEIESKISLD
ncbi:chromosome segregation protein SMC [Candidatus Sumerlaeota bacterium]|nr:chromosome segregation protein SMC [Candidatus Sumerlaeota bacterium]